MSRSFWSSFWLTPAILGATAFAAAAEPVQNTQPVAGSELQQIVNYSPSEEFAPLAGQVTSVSQLSDVRPTDWAFQALQSLVERYGCIVGYPDRTFRGNRALTRYEFAAGLNACMDRINELIAAATADLVRKEDLLALQKLQEEFAAELATLRGQVDALEARTETLERQQFSTTTKLAGEVIFAISDVFGDSGARGSRVSEDALNGTDIRIFDPADDDLDGPRGAATAIVPTINIATGGGDFSRLVRDRDVTGDILREVFATRGRLDLASDANVNQILDVFGANQRTVDGNFRFDPRRPDLPEQLIFTNRVRLAFDTSFTGRDRLRTRLEAINVTTYSQGGDGNTGTNMTRLGFDGNGSNEVLLDELWYRFPLGNNLTIQVDAFGGEYQDSVVYTFNPLFQSSGTGAISRFGRFNPIYRLPGDSAAGFALRYNFGDPRDGRGLVDKLTFEAGYLSGGDSGGTSNPSNPSQKNGLFDGGYAALAQLIFRPTTKWDLGLTYVRSYFPDGAVNLSRSTGSDLSRRPFSNRVATSGNHFGFQSVYRFSPQFTVAGWFGYTIAEAEDSLTSFIAGVPGITGVTQINFVNEGDNAKMINWGISLGFADLVKEGSLLGLIVGQQPRVIDNDSIFGDEDDSNWHVEGLFRYPVNDNIDITPGLLVIFNPENIGSNDTIVVGTVRATFRF
jgi:hypothetical protein